MLHCVFILSLFYNIVFSLQNVGGNQKLLLPFQVCGNDMVTEPSLQPNFGVCKTIPVFLPAGGEASWSLLQSSVSLL